MSLVSVWSNILTASHPGYKGGHNRWATIDAGILRQTPKRMRYIYIYFVSHRAFAAKDVYRKALKKLEDFQDKRVETEMWMMKTWNRNVWVPFFFVGEVPSFGVEYAYF